MTPETLRHTRVLVRARRILSCLTVERHTIRVNGASVSMGGIRHVATWPEERNRGYASALLADTLRWMRQQGIAVSILFPASFRFYRRFGYDLAGHHCEVWLRPTTLPAFAEANRCRAATVADLPALERLYQERSAICACALERPPQRWQALLASPEYRIVVFERSTPAGYLIVSETLDRYGAPQTRVHEFLAIGEEARRGLLGWLARCRSESLEWCASPGDLVRSGLLASPAPLIEGFRPRIIATVRPMFQIRIVHLPLALRALAPTWSGLDAEVGLQVRDELLRENEVPLAISAREGTVQIVEGHLPPHSLVAEIRVISQLYCGYLTAGEALSQGLLQGPPEAIRAADLLFPRLEPFIPDLDRF